MSGRLRARKWHFVTATSKKEEEWKEKIKVAASEYRKKKILTLFASSNLLHSHNFIWIAYIIRVHNGFCVAASTAFQLSRTKSGLSLFFTPSHAYLLR